MANSRLPRSRDAYKNKTHAGASNRSNFGDLTLNTREFRVEIARPSYSKGKLVFQPWPALDYRDPTRVVPGRFSAAVHDQSPWIVSVPAAKGVGIGQGNQITFHLYDPDAEDGHKTANPYRVLYWAVKNAADAGRFAGSGKVVPGTWAPLFKGQNRALTSLTSLYWTQGIVLQAQARIFLAKGRQPLGLAAGDALQVIQLPDTCGRALLEVLDEEKETWSGDAQADPQLPFKRRSPVGTYDPKTNSMRDGLILTAFHPKSCNNIVNTEKVTRTSWNGEISDTGQGYEIAWSRRFTVNGLEWTPDIEGAHFKAFMNKWQFWFDDPDTDQPGLLKIMSYPEQCVKLAHAFAEEPRLLKFGWADYPEYLSDEVTGILNKRAQVAQPGRGRADDPEDDDADLGDEEGYETRRGGKQGGGQTASALRTASNLRPTVDTDDGDEDEDEPAPLPGRVNSLKQVDDEDEDEDEDEDDGDEAADEDEGVNTPVTAPASETDDDGDAEDESEEDEDADEVEPADEADEEEETVAASPMPAPEPVKAPERGRPSKGDKPRSADLPGQGQLFEDDVKANEAAALARLAAAREAAKTRSAPRTAAPASAPVAPPAEGQRLKKPRTAR